MQTSDGDSDDNREVHESVLDEDADPFLFMGDQDLVGLWEGEETTNDHKKKVVRNWGIPSFSDQIDRGVKTFTLSRRDDSRSPSVTIHLEHRLHSTSSDLWDSALVLSHCLVRPGVLFPNHANPSFHGKTVLELGSGTGCVGLFCAKCLDAKHVVLTDLKENLNLLEKNRTENGLDEQVAVCPLDWTNQTLPSEVYFDQNGPDVIVGSDLFLPFARKLLLPLAKTLAAVLRIRPAHLPPSVALLVYEERFDCSDFFLDAASLNLVVTHIDDRLLHPVYQDPGRIHVLRITLL